eukprot:CAMPEP_0170569382 /NCGR_PEP_ID=MMETSP0224-20130122/511_1 /TAXON_ID=285029 /ORGANISM="Togula jolla, Strain CCCM 725" /LENGTH=158 /DNA_ID=CAMNT_0010891517 /DNA_START=969 /DNA_END=1441 /DNA_ORIENTATION=+
MGSNLKARVAIHEQVKKVGLSHNILFDLLLYSQLWSDSNQGTEGTQNGLSRLELEPIQAADKQSRNIFCEQLGHEVPELLGQVLLLYCAGRTPHPTRTLCDFSLGSIHCTSPYDHLQLLLQVLACSATALQLLLGCAGISILYGGQSFEVLNDSSTNL